jgi:hypothetical protein
MPGVVSVSVAAAAMLLLLSLCLSLSLSVPNQTREIMNEELKFQQ